jgi:hypothetical protein
MQLAIQNNDGPSATAGGSDKRPRSKKDARAGTIAAIHITWGKICRGKKLDKDELRQARLDFINNVLNPKTPIESLRDRVMTQAKLGKVLDAMRDLERAPLLPGAEQLSGVRCQGPAGPGTQNPEPGTGSVVHLATESQVATIEKLLAHLRWNAEATEGFIRKRFKTGSPRMLTVDAANKLTMILMTIAASRDIKDRKGVMRVSRVMIRMEIPELKRRLGIDQKPDGRQSTVDGLSEEEGEYE